MKKKVFKFKQTAILYDLWDYQLPHYAFDIEQII